MANDKKNASQDSEKTSFTVDAEQTGADMPSITKLLNRKSLSSRAPKAPAGPPSAPPPPGPPPAPSGEAYAPPPPPTSSGGPPKAAGMPDLEPPPAPDAPTTVMLTPPTEPPPSAPPPTESAAPSGMGGGPKINLDPPTLAMQPVADAPVIESQASSAAAAPAAGSSGGGPELSIAIESHDGFQVETAMRPGEDAPKPAGVSGAPEPEPEAGPDLAAASDATVPTVQPSEPESSEAGSALTDDGLTHPVSVIETSPAPPPSGGHGGFTLEEPALSLAPSASGDSEPEPEPEPKFESDLPPVIEQSEAPKRSVINARIQPAARRADRRAQAQLVKWELARLKGGVDPLGRGLAMLFERGATSALFLSITPPPAGAPVPHFVSTAVLDPPPAKLKIWTGLRWDPTVVPELWNFFVKSGVVELSPPGTKTNVASIRNVVRGAFGVEQGEWLTLLRAGPANACRGVVAVVSTAGLLDVIREPLALITSLPPKLAGKAA
jgi:hypothetical protein